MLEAELTTTGGFAELSSTPSRCHGCQIEEEVAARINVPVKRGGSCFTARSNVDAAKTWKLVGVMSEILP